MQTGAKCFKQVHMVTVARHIVVDNRVGVGNVVKRVTQHKLRVQR